MASCSYIGDRRQARRIQVGAELGDAGAEPGAHESRKRPALNTLPLAAVQVLSAETLSFLHCYMYETSLFPVYARRVSPAGCTGATRHGIAFAVSHSSWPWQRFTSDVLAVESQVSARARRWVGSDVLLVCGLETLGLMCGCTQVQLHTNGKIKRDATHTSTAEAAVRAPVAVAVSPSENGQMLLWLVGFRVSALASSSSSPQQRASISRAEEEEREREEETDSMDLSMILSPALEEEERGAPMPPPAPPLPEPSRKWSADELQCAVAILQDFQQPLNEASVHDNVDIRGREARQYFPEQQQQHYSQQQDVDVKPAFTRSDDIINDKRGKENKRAKAPAQQQQQNVAGADDITSKLDLLVQADAIIKRRRPKKASATADDKSQYLRSGVWSRAEEEYAAALVSFFLEGLLDLPEGMTLRKFLAEKLCCNRRRVSMKLGTESLAGQKIPRKVGASVFVAADPPPSKRQRQEVRRVLDELREASFSSGSLNENYLHENDEGDSHPKRRLFKQEDDEERDDSLHFYQRSSAYYRKGKSTRNGLKPKRGKPTIIRTGFESPEEEEFVTTMFEYFTAGTLDLPDGTKLVTYLCRQLGCTPKELSMKLAPQRMGERKFPDNVGSITYMRKNGGSASPASSDEEDFSEELFEVESRLTELRLAHEEAHQNAPPTISTPVKSERKFSSVSVSSTGTISSVTSTPSSSPVRAFRRSGPWSHDEEVFAAALIDCFFKGVLDIAEGTTLRAFLSSRLCCNPMRISKKLASECIAEIPIPKKLGSSTYVRRPETTLEEQTEAEDILQSLQHKYIALSSRKGSTVSGSKRPRSIRGPRPAALTLGTDSDSTESDSDASSRPHGKSPEKLQKTAKSYSPAHEARRQRFHMPHVGPELVVPAPLKEQLA